MDGVLNGTIVMTMMKTASILGTSSSCPAVSCQAIKIIMQQRVQQVCTGLTKVQLFKYTVNGYGRWWLDTCHGNKWVTILNTTVHTGHLDSVTNETSLDETEVAAKFESFNSLSGTEVLLKAESGTIIHVWLWI